MTASLLPLCLRQEQFAQVLSYLSVYRSYLWQCVLPTPERNQTIRDVLELHRHLEKEQEPGDEGSVLLVVNVQERQILQQVFWGLTQVYARATPSEQRSQALGEIASLCALVERLGHSSQQARGVERRGEI